MSDIVAHPSSHVRRYEPPGAFMKKLYPAILLAAIFLSSCTKPPSGSGETDALSSLSAANTRETTQATEPLSRPAQYIALVESYMDDSVFRPIEEDGIRELSKLLQGHYDITGRTDGNGFNYYMAVRREDAPVYDDFKDVSISYYSEAGTDGEELRVGYYNNQGEENILYSLGGYSLLDMPFGYDTLNSFCFGLSEPGIGVMNPSFLYAFDENGRAKLDFLKNKPGLSLYDDITPSIRFYYQDDDTVKFYSEPYPCRIALDDDKAEMIRGLLTSLGIEDVIHTRQGAFHYLQNNRAIRPTGAFLDIDGREYEFWGSCDTPGYMVISSGVDNEFAIGYSEELYRLVMDEINDVVGMDYGSFDPEWFKKPLKSAAISFPEFLIPGDGGEDTFQFEVRTQTILDRKKLDVLSKLMDQTVNDTNLYGFSKCPYEAAIDFLREDGKTLRIYAATDSCDSMAYEGRIGFEYGSQAELAAIFDEAMAYRLEPKSKR